MLNGGHAPDWTGPTVERVMSNSKRGFVLAFRRWPIEPGQNAGDREASETARPWRNGAVPFMNGRPCALLSDALRTAIPLRPRHADVAWAGTVALRNPWW